MTIFTSKCHQHKTVCTRLNRWYMALAFTIGLFTGTQPRLQGSWRSVQSTTFGALRESICRGMVAWNTISGTLSVKVQLSMLAISDEKRSDHESLCKKNKWAFSMLHEGLECSIHVSMTLCWRIDLSMSGWCFVKSRHGYIGLNKEVLLQATCNFVCGR